MESRLRGCLQQAALLRRDGFAILQGALPRQKSSAAEAAGPAGPCLALSTKKEERARRLRGRGGKFEAPGEDEEDALEAELGPLASEQLRRASS